MLNFIIDSMELSCGDTSANNKIISEATYLTGIQQHNISGLFIAGGGYGFAGYLYCFQQLLLRKSYSNTIIAAILPLKNTLVKQMVLSCINPGSGLHPPGVV